MSPHAQALVGTRGVSAQSSVCETEQGANSLRQTVVSMVIKLNSLIEAGLREIVNDIDLLVQRDWCLMMNV